MSIKVIQWVWDCSQSKNAERLVLLAIADNAADDGSHAYPSLAELQRKANLSERAVRDALRRLEASGELVTHFGGGRGGTNYYTVIMKPCDRQKGAESAPHNLPRGAESAGVEGQILPVKGAESAPGTVPEPSPEPSKNPSASPRGARLPEDWKPGENLMLWYRSEFLPNGWSGDARENCRREHEKFRDHWLAAAGQTARKKDWDAAWRNWMRRAWERRSPVAPVSAPPSPKPFVQAADEYKADKAARSSKFWQAVDELIEYAQGRGHQLPGDDAIKIVQGLVDSGELDLDSPNGLKPSVPSLYSGYQDVITVDAEEVPGS